MAKHFAKIIVYGAQSVGRAFIKAVRQEIEASRAAAQQHRLSKRKQNTQCHDLALKGMTLSEAQQILNVKDLSNPDEIRINYEHLFRSNEKELGGSFYIQSKVFRAKQRIDSEIQQKLNKGISKPESTVIEAKMADRKS